MAITTLADAVAGIRYVVDFVKISGTTVAGRPHSLFTTAGMPPTGVMPANIAITSSSAANPTVITTATHGYTSGDSISIIGHTGSTPAIDGIYTITVINTTSFSIPVEVTVGGTGGVCACFNSGGSGTAGLTGLSLSNQITGQLPFRDPISGNSYLARLQAISTGIGTLLLCDRLWHCAGINPTLTSEQVFTSSVQIPARDQDGTNAGDGVFAAIEIITVVGVGTPVITFKYTNQATVSDRTAITINPTVASSIAGTFYPIALASGDTGVQKAQSITQNATWTSGAYGIVLYRIIARLECPFANMTNAIDALTGGFPRIYNGTVPFLVYIPASVAQTIQGHAIFTQG